MSTTESVRNPFRFPIQSRHLADLETAQIGGVMIGPGEIITGVPVNKAEAACATGVLQMTHDGIWDFDGKCDLQGRPTT